MGYAIRTIKYRYVELYKRKNDKKRNILAKELIDHIKDLNENMTNLNIQTCKNLAILLRKNFNIPDN
ncbi:hypothetical protein EGI22_11480 [Lacihabitans sp. LS3-19]|nr:hypothetical protein [Lacihabitans sp. LS3-19]